MLIEFPADDPARALRFWEGVLGRPLAPRTDDQGEGWQTGGGEAAVGVHARRRGTGRPGLPPLLRAWTTSTRPLARVDALGGERHPPGRALDDLPRLRGQPLRARPARLSGLRPSVGPQARR